MLLKLPESRQCRTHPCGIGFLIGEGHKEKANVSPALLGIGFQHSQLGRCPALHIGGAPAGQPLSTLEVRQDGRIRFR